MLNQALNRCQATPMVMCRAITITQVIEMTILTMATRKTRLSRVPVVRPWNGTPMNQVSGKSHFVPVPWAYSRPRRISPQTTTPRMTASTK